MAGKFNQLKERLTRRFNVEASESIAPELVQRAVTDAEALAWSTSYPLLLLPVLAEEKVARAQRWQAQQREILERQKALAAIL